MAVQIPAGFGHAAVEIRNSGDPDPWYFTFGVLLDQYEENYEAAAEFIYDAAVTFIGGDLSNTAALTGVKLTVGMGVADNLIVTYSETTTGSSSGQKLPSNCALLVDKNTGIGGRKNRGRFFLPGILNENQVDMNGVIQPGVVGAFQTAANTFLDTLNTTTVPPADPNTPMTILHNAGGVVPTPTPVNSLSVQGIISTQRRRLR